MNIAYHIIAWSQPDLLKRMVSRLNQPNVHFFIHIDKKNKDYPSYKPYFDDFNNVTLLSEYEVYWGGLSQVKTAMHLLTLACNFPMQFKYHVLLSGQDYPIKPNSYINNFFEAHSCDFMSYNRIADLPDIYLKKYQYHHFFDNKLLNPKDPRKNKLLYYLFNGFYNRFGKYLPKRSFYKDYTPYFGSDWLVLSDGSARFILDFTKRNPDYVRFMKYNEIPSELYIHNILLNSERRTNVVDYDRFQEWLKHKKPGDVFMPRYASLRYMDWSDTGQATKPAFLDATYFDVIKNDPNLFARKMHETISAELLDKIDVELL
ncbi:MAG: beta-1,6-N-acetylglucosaminyltransferase [Bacteroidota bacterium]